jgi:hypothetical protein
MTVTFYSNAALMFGDILLKSEYDVLLSLLRLPIAIFFLFKWAFRYCFKVGSKYFLNFLYSLFIVIIIIMIYHVLLVEYKVF